MNTHSHFSAAFASLVRALAALIIVAFGITGIAAIISDTELSLDFVFGNQTWIVWLATSILLLAVFAGVVSQLIKPALRYNKGRFNYRHC